MKAREMLNDNNYIEALLKEFGAEENTSENTSISPDNIFTILDKEWDERTHCLLIIIKQKKSPL